MMVDDALRRLVQGVPRRVFRPLHAGGVPGEDLPIVARAIGAVGEADLEAVLDRDPAAVARAGGRVTTDLPIIHGVAALLDDGARRRLAVERAVSLSADTRVYTSSADARDQIVDTRQPQAIYPLYPALATGAYLLHQEQVQTTKSQCENRTVTTLGASSFTFAKPGSTFASLPPAILFSARRR